MHANSPLFLGWAISWFGPGFIFSKIIFAVCSPLFASPPGELVDNQ